jgi:hypothetical protein
MDDRVLAASHESAHRVTATFLGSPWSCAWIWPSSSLRGRWDGMCLHDKLDRYLQPIVYAAGAAAEAIEHGLRRPADMVRFLGAEDRAGTAGIGLEGALRYCEQVLGGPLRKAWQADTAVLRRELRIGQNRSRRPTPPNWKPPQAADESKPILVKGQSRMPNNPDAITAICTFLRDEAGLSEEAMAQVDQMLIEVIAQATHVPAASLSMDQAPRSSRAAYSARFPLAGRLASYRA